MRERAAAFFRLAFHERQFATLKNGVFARHSISAPLQALAAAAAIAGIAWSVFASRLYFASASVFEAKDRQVQKARDNFNLAIADMRAYRDTIEAINLEIAKQHDALALLLESDGKISKKERDKIVKKRSLLTAELEYVGRNMSEYISNARFAQAGQGAAGLKKLELEKNIVMNENVSLKKRNEVLENSLEDMTELQNSLVDKVSVLSQGRIGEIERILAKVDTVLAQANLKNRASLVEKARAEREEGLGGRFVPLRMSDIADEALSKKFKDAAAKVNLWEGLSAATGMLPLGAPVRGTARITSAYGVREDPFLGVPAMHTGIDFSGKDGTPLYSTSRGKVTQAGNRGDYGLSVEVYHGMGFSTIYAHLSKAFVSRGDLIDEGAKIGLAGSTGRSTAPHLHYELRHNGRALNPYAFVKTENE
ncbi:MAG: M23 family metallopeptidase [Rickettsiales bacterium]|nr:M23 family metallopeptidase [Rickettsiales bacterium]